MRRVLVVVTVLVLISACSSNTGPGGRQEAESRADFSFTTFEGEEFSADQHRGVPVVLNFWESW